jgi:hypothetical protein
MLTRLKIWLGITPREVMFEKIDLPEFKVVVKKAVVKKAPAKKAPAKKAPAKKAAVKKASK